MEFGNLDIVEKTFTRKVNNPRGQDYQGIKFRRWVSAKKGTVGKIEETFTFSDKLFAELNLDIYALTEAKLPDGVLLLVVEDQVEVKPPAKFLRQSFNADGTKQGKGKMFSNSILVDDLVEKKLLDPDTKENQYLALIDITSEFKDMPTNVKGIYKIVVDETAYEEEQETDEQNTQEETVSQPVSNPDSF